MMTRLCTILAIVFTFAYAENNATIFKGHTNEVSALAYHPLKPIIASGSLDGTIKLWSENNASILSTLKENSGNVHALTFSGNGDLLAVSTSINKVEVFELNSSKVKYSYSPLGSISVLAFSPDNQLLACASIDGNISILNASDGKLLGSLQGHTFRVNDIVFSDNSTLVSGSGDGTVKVWDTGTFLLKKSLEGHTRWVTSLDVLTGVNKVVSTSYDGSIRIWDLQTFESKIFKNNLGKINGIRSINSHTFVTHSNDNAIDVWNDEDTNKSFSMPYTSSNAKIVLFSSRGKIAATSSDFTFSQWALPELAVANIHLTLPTVEMNKMNIDVFIIDASSTMVDFDADNKMKMLSLRKAFAQHVKNMDLNNTAVEVISFNAGCSSAKVAVEPTNDLQEAISTFNALQPGGNTPLASSMELLDEQLKTLHDDSNITVTLIVDGVESCGGNTAAQIQKVVAHGIVKSIRLIGYNITDTKVDQQLQELATAAKGKYTNVKNLQELVQALSIKQ